MPKLEPDLLTPDDRTTLRRVGDVLWSRRDAIAGEWARRLVAAQPELAVVRDLVTGLNGRILELVLTRCREGDFSGLYDAYYERTYELVEADLQIGRVSEESLRTMHASARISWAVIGEQPAMTAPMLAAYLKLGLDLVMLADQAHADCHHAFFARAQELVAAAGRRNEEFVAVLAHEVRNPLAAMRNAVALLRCEPRQTPDGRAAVDIVDRQLTQVSRLVDDLYDLAHLAHGKLTFRRERVDLATVVATAVEAVRPQIDARRQRLRIALPPESAWLSADPIRLVQVVSNLLGNATRYTDDGGEIALVAAWEGDELALEVRDTGIGIDPAMLPHVFDPFVRLPNAGRRQGLGIGLMLVRALVQMHDGSITAASDGVGKGSRFVVRLPRGVDRPDPPAH